MTKKIKAILQGKNVKIGNGQGISKNLAYEIVLEFMSILLH